VSLSSPPYRLEPGSIIDEDAHLSRKSGGGGRKERKEERTFWDCKFSGRYLDVKV